MKQCPMAVVVVVALAGCTVPGLRTDRVEMSAAAVSPKTSGEAIDYTYRLLTPEQTGLTQVFDDGRRTYLTFEAAAPTGLMIFDQNGKAMPFTIGGHTAIVSGIRAGLLLRTPTKSSYAQSPILESMARVTANAPGETDTAALPVELAAARAEILRAQERIAGLAVELDQSAQGEPSVRLAQIRSEIEEIQTRLNGVDALLMRMHFASGSTLLTLSASSQEAILSAARRAEEVRIRGRADSSGTPGANLQLARERALSVRHLLIAGGVARSKLRTSYARADYIASNATAQGRADNRRVDLVFMGLKIGLIQGAMPRIDAGSSIVASRTTPLPPARSSDGDF
jgi:OOP family OmpA-OmpF porin